MSFSKISLSSLSSHSDHQLPTPGAGEISACRIVIQKVAGEELGINADERSKSGEEREHIQPRTYFFDSIINICINPILLDFIGNISDTKYREGKNSAPPTASVLGIFVRHHIMPNQISAATGYVFSYLSSKNLMPNFADSPRTLNHLPLNSTQSPRYLYRNTCETLQWTYKYNR